MACPGLVSSFMWQKLGNYEQRWQEKKLKREASFTPSGVFVAGGGGLELSWGPYTRWRL